jgi:ABC-2 type transport system permease protein
LLLWLTFTLIIPRAAAALAKAAVPLPSSTQFWAAIRHDYEQGLPGDGTLAGRSKRHDAALLDQYRVSRLENLPVGAYGLRRMQRDAYADKVHAIHFDRLWARYQQQESIVLAVGWLSPSVALRLASMKFAGTDLRHRKHFEDAAEAYRQYVNTSIDQWDVTHSRGLRSFEDKYADNSVWQSIRRFDYHPLSARAAYSFAGTELLMLGGWLIVAGALLAASWKKVRP